MYVCLHTYVCMSLIKDVYVRVWISPEAVGPTSTVWVAAAAALHSGAVTVQGKLGQETVEMMPDSGSSDSLLGKDGLK